jgi:DNA modification methylase
MKDNDKKIEQVATASLVPYAKNAKKHDAAQAAAIAGSIREFGFNNPVLIDADNGIIAGHGRVLAAHQLGLEHVPCLRLTHLTDTQKRAYILADNRLAELGGGWDAEMLAAELESLSAEGITMEEIGFDADALEELGAGLGDEGNPEADAEPQIDKAEELRAKWGVEPGQLWELGAHRLLCGDSTKPEDVSRLMDGQKAEMVFTDPPYALFGNSTGVHGIADDKMVRPFFRDIGRASMEWVENFGHVYLCCDWHTASVIQSVIGEVGLTAKNLCVWDKGDGGIGANYQQCYELIWFFTNSPRAKGTMARKEAGEKTVNGVPNIWRFPRVQKDRIHNAEKPVGMVSVPITNGSKQGNIVLDFFSGSGTVLIACEQLGRKCRAIEISPAYVAVAIQRWADATGKTPNLAA